jgi:drug/metabolite transporter (DMT)-like permease
VGAALVLTAAAGYGTLGVLARLATDAGLSTIAFVSWRALLGTLLLVSSVTVAARVGLTRVVPLRVVPARHWAQVCAVALLSVVANLALFAAIERTLIAFVLICFYTFPVMVAVAATRVYGEPLTRLRIASLALATGGLALVVVAPALGGATVDVDGVGLLLGLVAAVAQAIYALIAGRGYASLPALQAATAVTVVTAVAFVTVAVLGGSASALAEPMDLPGSWALLILAATIGQSIPTAAILAGYRRLGPTRASILMLFEPLVGILLAALLVAERPGPLQLVGGLLVLAGAFLAQLPDRQRRSASLPGVA